MDAAVDDRPQLTLPNLRQHLTIIGRNGSGKTRFGAWALSKAPFNRQPFIIIDYKGEDLFRRIEKAENIKLDDKLPRIPGIYIARPRADQDADVNRFLMRIYDKGKTGIFVDEGLMLPKEPAYFGMKNLLSQGRSKHIPLIICTQKPSYISTSTFSEASYLCVFHLIDARDKRRVGEFTPDDPVWNLDRRLPDYYSRWYDVNRDRSLVLRPVPDDEVILDEFDAKLRSRRKVL